jgi:glycosyltransferase involved in cell wall biosynthesis
VLGVIEKGMTSQTAPRRGRPSVSVMVPSYLGAQRLPGCLESLAAQTLDPAEFEIVVVLNGPPDGSDEVVVAFSEVHAHHHVRTVELSEPGAGNARNIGLSVARGAYITFIDDDDRVTPTYLAAMLAVAEPDVVVATLIGNVAEGATQDDPPDIETYIGRGLAPLAGQTVAGQDLVTAFSYNAAKLVSIDIARLATYDPELSSGEDHVYWLALFAQRPFRLRVVSEPDAMYLRSMRFGGVGRQQTSYDFNVIQRLRCMKAIEKIDRSDPAVASVARGLMKGQAWWVNYYLHRYPEDHAQVVADVAAHGLREVPWSSINEGLARDLAICYCFPPDLDTSGVVAAKRLRERGVVTDVISHDLSRLRTVDPNSKRIAEEVLGRTHVVTGVASFSNWKAVPPFVEETWGTVLEWERRQGLYRSVYSRAMAVNAHYAAALVKLRRRHIEWVAEFSDPLKLNPLGEVRMGDVGKDWLSEELARGVQAAGFEVGPDPALFEWAEHLAYALADRIVFTNAAQMELMLGYCCDDRLVRRVRSIAEVRPHPTLPRRFYDMLPAQLPRSDDVVNLAYFGVFYSTRDLGDVVRALVRLRQDERERVRLHVFTSNPDVLTLQVVRAGLAGVVKVHPFVPVLEFLNLTTQFDVLVVDDAATAQHHGRNPYLPSKVADYMGSGTPVWAICEPGSVMSSLDLEVTSPLGDVDAALTVLRSLIAARAGS